MELTQENFNKQRSNDIAFAEQWGADEFDDWKLFSLMEDNNIDEDKKEACRAYLELGISENLDDFEESYCGQFSSDKEFAQDMAENLGSVDTNATWPQNCIDWEYAARELMMDYSEQDGFYFRNL